MPGWVFTFRREQAFRIARLREHAPRAVLVAETGDIVWAQTECSRDDAEKLLALVPAAELFERVGDDRLRPLGRLVPTKRLPPVGFTPVERSLELRVPGAKVPGKLEGDVSIRLVPSTRPTAVDGETLLLGRLGDLLAYADEAPGHRLAPLAFAVNEADEVLLRGRPVPAMPGGRFLLSGGVATPVGLAWAPALAPGVIREWLGLEAGTIVLFRRDGSLSEIPEHAFVPLGRSVLNELRTP